MARALVGRENHPRHSATGLYEQWVQRTTELKGPFFMAHILGANSKEKVFSAIGIPIFSFAHVTLSASAPTEIQDLTKMGAHAF